jgi:TRAP-type C4-dicarboxylate transport system permease small subunit
MNEKRDPNLRKQNQHITSIINALMIYIVSGAMIVYGGVNISLNALQWSRGFYEGQWAAAIPFVLLFGLLPVIAGVMLLAMHPATRNERKPTKPKK